MFLSVERSELDGNYAFSGSGLSDSMCGGYMKWFHMGGGGRGICSSSMWGEGGGVYVVAPRGGRGICSGSTWGEGYM